MSSEVIKCDQEGLQWMESLTGRGVKGTEKKKKSRLRLDQISQIPDETKDEQK